MAIPMEATSAPTTPPPTKLHTGTCAGFDITVKQDPSRVDLTAVLTTWMVVEPDTGIIVHMQTNHGAKTWASYDFKSAVADAEHLAMSVRAVVRAARYAARTEVKS